MTLALVRRRLRRHLIPVVSSFLHRHPNAALRLRRLVTHGRSVDFCETLRHIKSTVPTVHTVIDVGANRGLFAKAAAAVFSPRTIMAFEPNCELHQDIHKNCQVAEVFPFALSSTPGRGLLHKHSHPGMTSLLPINDTFRRDITWDPVQKIQVVPVELKPLADFIDDTQLLERATLLKLDTQGTELDIVLSGGDRLAACCAIIIEYMFWSGYKGRPTFAEMVRCLDVKGFQLGMVCDMRFRQNGTPAVVDCVFLPTHDH